MNDEVIEFYNWFIGVSMQYGGDITGPMGYVKNHPNFEDREYFTPSSFLSFDRTTMIGKSFSGRTYHFSQYADDRNNTTEKDAITWIENRWVKYPS